MIKILSIIFLFVISQSCISQSYLTGYGKVFPIEPKYDNTFEVFLTKFKTAVDSFDKEFIYSVIDPNIEFGEGSDDIGLKGFKLKYNLNDSFCDFWKINYRILSWGGEWKNSVYEFPNDKFSKFCDENFKNIENRIFSSKNNDYDFYGVAIGDQVPVFNKPNDNSSIKGYLKYEVVKILNYKNDFWNKVQLYDKKTGYVRKDDLYEEMGDYCITFRKVGSKWMINLYCPTGL